MEDLPSQAWVLCPGFVLPGFPGWGLELPDPFLVQKKKVPLTLSQLVCSPAGCKQPYRTPASARVTLGPGGKGMPQVPFIILSKYRQKQCHCTTARVSDIHFFGSVRGLMTFYPIRELPPCPDSIQSGADPGFLKSSPNHSTKPCPMAVSSQHPLSARPVGPPGVCSPS